MTTEVRPSDVSPRARGAERMRLGRRLVLYGFGIAVAGIVAYCVTCFASGPSPTMGIALLQRADWIVGGCFTIIGAGTLLWLVGSFIYFGGALDSDPQGPDLHF